MSKRSICLLLGVVLLFTACSPMAESASALVESPIVIAIPYTLACKEQDLKECASWLRAQTGIPVTFIVSAASTLEEYITLTNKPGNIDCDALWGFPVSRNPIETNLALRNYAEKGYIQPLNHLVDTEGQHLQKIWDEWNLYDLQQFMTANDGNLYYMPVMEKSQMQLPSSAVWINNNWLAHLGLPLPQTTDELTQTLAAFKTGDPNGNSTDDEVPLIMGWDSSPETTADFIINAFIPCASSSSYLYRNSSGQLSFAPVEPQWQKALQYLADLHGQGLLSTPTITARGLSQLASAPQDVLGGFCAPSIADVSTYDCQKEEERYLPLMPLKGPDGLNFSVPEMPTPKPYGLLTTYCKRPQQTVQLMDFLLSPEAASMPHAACIQYFPADPTQAQPPWQDGEYTTGLPLGVPLLDNSLVAEYYRLQCVLVAYTDTSLQQFVSGELDPFDNVVWDSYVADFYQLGLEEFLTLSHLAYQ